MKKISNLLIPTLSLVLLAGCVDIGPDGSVYTDKGTFAYEAVTSVGFLGILNENESAPMTLKKNSVSDTTVEAIKEYLPAVDAAFNGESQIAAVDKESDRQEYSKHTVITYLDVNNQEKTIAMYYNETEKVDFDDDDKDEDEREYRIEGVLLVDGLEYTMLGEKELDKGELEINFRYMLDENTYVKVEQEIETGEQEFEYEIYQNGRKIYEYSLELENDEVELKVKDASSALSSLKLEFERVTRNGKNYLKCEVEENKTKDTIYFEKVVLDDGSSTYVVVTL